MRFSFILPLLLSSAAFILSLLVLLAGKDTNFLSSIYLLKINTSNINPSTTLITNTLGLPSSVTDIINKLPESEVDQITQTAAKKLGLRDFYTSHVMTYCEGFDFNKTSGSTNTTEERVTYCSNPKGMFTFDPISIFQAELISGVTVDDLGIPDEAKSGIKTVGVAYKAMFITYLIGVILSGLLIVLTLLSGWIESRLVAFFVGLFSFLALVALALASAIGTAIAIKLRDVFNQYMVPKLNIYAQSSAGYLAMTWTAVGCMLLAMIYWTGMCCCGTGRRTRRRERKMANRENDTERTSGEEGLIGNHNGTPEMKERSAY